MSELKNLRSSEKNTSLQTPEYNKLRSDIISSPGQNIQRSEQKAIRIEKAILETEDVNTDLERTRQEKVYSQSSRPAAYQFQHRKNVVSGNGFYQTMNQTLGTLGNYTIPVQQTQVNYQQPICMNILVVSKEEIEAPWRSECEYLQSVICDLEKNKKTEVVKEYVKVEDTGRITLLEEEQRRLRDVNSQQTTEISRLKEQILQLQSDNKGLSGDNKTLKTENKQLSGDKKSLQADLKTLQEENNNLKVENRSLRDQLEALQRQLNQLQKDLEGKQKEIDLLKQQGQATEFSFYQINQDAQSLRDQLEQHKNHVVKLQAVNSSLSDSVDVHVDEKEQLRIQLLQRNEEISSLRLQLQNLQLQLQDAGRFKDFEAQVLSLKQEIDRLNKELRTRSTDYDALRSKYNDLETQTSRRINELQNKIRDLENTIGLMQSEIDRLNSLIKTKNEEIDRWRFQYEELEQQGVTVIQEKVTYLSQEVEVWKQRFIKVNHEFNQTQEELIMCQAELESIKKGGKKEMVITTKTMNTVVRKSGQTSDSNTYSRSEHPSSSFVKRQE